MLLKPQHAIINGIKPILDKEINKNIKKSMLNFTIKLLLYFLLLSICINLIILDVNHQIIKLVIGLMYLSIYIWIITNLYINIKKDDKYIKYIKHIKYIKYIFLDQKGMGFKERIRSLKYYFIDNLIFSKFNIQDKVPFILKKGMINYSTKVFKKLYLSLKSYVFHYVYIFIILFGTYLVSILLLKRIMIREVLDSSYFDLVLYPFKYTLRGINKILGII